jgi:RNA polymerase sigma factor (sigma-70 family)
LSNDEELVALCRKNNREAQKKLFEKYASKMMGICLRYIGNTDDAKDAMQDGFVKVFSQLNSFEFKSSLETWMSRIFMNLSINRVTRGLAKYTHIDIADTNLTHEEDEATVYSWGNLTQTQVLEELQALPEIYRIVLNMYAIDGLSHQEIADSLDISVGSSKSRLSRARVLLKDRIAQIKN